MKPITKKLTSAIVAVVAAVTMVAGGAASAAPHASAKGPVVEHVVKGKKDAKKNKGDKWECPKNSWCSFKPRGQR